MDNFMDKLAKRFNAGEMIKANAQAEARDLKRLQEQTAQYEHMMQEMRRLNLKNVEVTEQVQQLIQCGIEQFEGYGTADNAIVTEIQTKTDSINQNIDEKLGSVDQKIDEKLGSVEGKVDEKFDSVDRKLEDKTASLESKLEDIKAYISSEIEKGSDNQAVIADISAKLDFFARDLRTELQNSQMEIVNSMRNLEEKLSSQSGQEEAISKLDTTIATSRYAIEDGLSGIKEEVLATKTFLTNSQNGVLDSQKRMEEHVHRENVRVYRNVQACVIDETQKRTRELSVRLDAMDASVKNVSGMKGLLIFTFLLVLLSIGLQVLQILNLLPI